MTLTIAAILLTIHSIVCGVQLYDLLNVSQRPNKLQWGLFLMFLPVVSVYLYQRSKKRDRLHNGDF